MSWKTSGGAGGGAHIAATYSTTSCLSKIWQDRLFFQTYFLRFSVQFVLVLFFIVTTQIFLNFSIALHYSTLQASVQCDYLHAIMTKGTVEDSLILNCPQLVTHDLKIASNTTFDVKLKKHHKHLFIGRKDTSKEARYRKVYLHLKNWMIASSLNMNIKNFL